MLSHPRPVRCRAGWVLVMLAVSHVGACDDPCKGASGVRVELAGSEQDPALGTFEGTLSWLQTAEETSINLTLTETASEAVVTCRSGTVVVDLTLSTGDGVLSEARPGQRKVLANGFISDETFALSLDPATLVEAGKVPETPDILDRNPVASLTLTPDAGGTYEAVLVLRSTTDSLHVAVASLRKVEP